MCYKAMNEIRKWLRRLGYNEPMARATVKSFYSTMTSDDKDTLLDAFAEPNSSIRILVSSDALAHGKDIADIEVVVIYCMPRDKEPSIFLQKFGRAARGNGYTGKAILFGDSWCIGDRGNHSPANPSNSTLKKGRRQQHMPAREDAPNEEEAIDLEISSMVTASDALSPRSVQSRTLQLNSEINSDPNCEMACHTMDELIKPKRRSKTNIEKRADLPFVIWDFMNSTGCLRRIFLRHFCEELPTEYHTERCCSNCNPALSVRKEFDLDFVESETSKDQEFRDSDLVKHIQKWLTDWLDNNMNDYDFALLPDHVMSKRQIVNTCSIALSSMDRHSLKEHLQSYPDVKILREDIEKLVDFIIDARESELEKRASDAPAGTCTSPQGSGRKRKRSATDAPSVQGRKRKKRSTTVATRRSTRNQEPQLPPMVARLSRNSVKQTKRRALVGIDPNVQHPLGPSANRQK